MSKGWFLLGYERELKNEVEAASIGARRLVVVRGAGGVRVFDGVCPHRGASLGHGGTLDGETIRCPFHGFRIGLGRRGEHQLQVEEVPSLVAGGLVFCRLSENGDNGFAEYMRRLDGDHYIVPGFTLRTTAPPALVIENAFDACHFRTVHGILNEARFTVEESVEGALVASGQFRLPPSPWQRGPAGSEVEVPYRATAFSPWLVVSQMGGDHPYQVITAATPDETGVTSIRLSIAVPAAAGPPDDELCRYLLERSRRGLEQDREVWERMTPGAVQRLVGADEPVARFQAYTRGFVDDAAA